MWQLKKAVRTTTSSDTLFHFRIDTEGWALKSIKRLKWIHYNAHRYDQKSFSAEYEWRCKVLQRHIRLGLLKIEPRLMADLVDPHVRQTVVEAICLRQGK
jgi:hypothetical protein